MRAFNTKMGRSVSAILTAAVAMSCSASLYAGSLTHSGSNSMGSVIAYDGSITVGDSIYSGTYLIIDTTGSLELNQGGTATFQGSVVVNGSLITIGDGNDGIVANFNQFQSSPLNWQELEINQILHLARVGNNELKPIADQFVSLNIGDIGYALQSLSQNNLSTQAAIGANISTNNANTMRFRANNPTVGVNLTANAVSSDRLARDFTDEPFSYATFLQNEEALMNDAEQDDLTGSPVFDWFSDSEAGIYLLTGYTQTDVDAQGGQVGSEAKQMDVFFGGDFLYNENLRVGGAIGYAAIESETNKNLGNTDVDAISLLSYANYHVTPKLRLDASAGVTFSNYDIERNIFMGGAKSTAKAETDARQYSLEIGVNYLIDELNVPNLTVTPYGYLRYNKIEIDGYSESGAGAANQKVDDQEDTSIVSSVGALVSYKIDLNEIVWEPFISASYEHEFDNDSRNVFVAFVGDPSNPFTASIDETDANYYKVSVGSLMKFGERMVGQVNYETVLGNNDLDSHRITAGLRVNF